MQRIDPITDVRWKQFLDEQPTASIFHTPEWLRALRDTYGYEPLAFVPASPREEIRNALVFCQIDSWLTGRRLVSVPFSDHAGLLANEPGELNCMLSSLRDQLKTQSNKYIEIRPTSAVPEGDSSFGESEEYCWHRLSLEPSIDNLFQSFHKSCIQRKIKRAAREKLDYTEGRSELLIKQYYRLLLITHSRHGLPPQPISWFRNLVDCMGEAIKIRIASKNGRPIAGMITLAYKKTMVYKYGCSDADFHNLGGMMLLFWKTIQEAKSLGFSELDMGRSDMDNPGLIAFKDHWGANRSALKYWRYPATVLANASKRRLRWAKRLFGVVPASTLPLAGKLLYRHAG
jgi:hypothetical protein